MLSSASARARHRAPALFHHAVLQLMRRTKALVLDTNEEQQLAEPNEHLQTLIVSGAEVGVLL